MNNLLKILIFFFIIHPIYSQRGELPESLHEYIRYAQQNSLAAKAARSNFESRKWRYQSIKSNFLPQVSFNMSAPGLVREINSITQPDGSELFREQSQLMSWGNLSVGQQIPLTGGNISVSSGLNRIDILGDQATSVWQTTPVQLSYTQPIFQHNDMRWQQQLESMRFLQSDNRLNEDMEDIAIQVTQRFFDLYISKMNYENAQFNVAINDTLYQLSKGRFEVGRIAENDLLQAELNYLNSQNELENTRLTYLESMEQLKIIIGYYGDNDLKIDPPKITMDLYADYEILLEEALENRSDITSFKIEEIEAEREISRARDRNNFELFHRF
jgi:outer membrane protein TolC